MSDTVIGHGKVATFHYTLRDDSGAILDASVERGPMAYLHGSGNIVAGLEEAMEGRGAGARFDVVVPPEKGYGAFDAEGTQQVHRSQFPSGFDPEVGQPIQAQSPDGQRMVFWVVGKKGAYVTLTSNHPLAGKNLHFAVEVVAVRDASPEEVAHGHVHGPGGHHH
jgi:FKBP-type peptidyl-prolyl cis-trans isomerase SlyD